MKENSIKEDIKLLREMKNNCLNRFEYYTDPKAREKAEAIEHILSDYKRLRKENEELTISNKEIDKEYIEKLQKENEKYKRLSEMNLKNAEEFKNNMCEHRCLLKSENEELKKFITEGITVVPHSPYKNYRLDFLRENFVSKKKIKDKIEELKKDEYSKYYYMFLEERDLKYTIQILQELLEESEDSKDGEG